jgi:predicted nucleic acid-binding protein
LVTFVDTSALYAILVRDDKNHEAALDAFRRLMAGEATLLTTNYVMLETVALLQKRLGIEAVRTLHDDYAPLIQVDWIAEEDHVRAVEAVLLAGRRKLSFVDCISFRSMRRLHVTTAFTFGDHFREQGFTVVPRA